MKQVTDYKRQFFYVTIFCCTFQNAFNWCNMLLYCIWTVFSCLVSVSVLNTIVFGTVCTLSAFFFALFKEISLLTLQRYKGRETFYVISSTMLRMHYRNNTHTHTSERKNWETEKKSDVKHMILCFRLFFFIFKQH